MARQKIRYRHLAELLGQATQAAMEWLAQAESFRFIADWIPLERQAATRDPGTWISRLAPNKAQTADETAMRLLTVLEWEIERQLELAHDMLAREMADTLADWPGHLDALTRLAWLFVKAPVIFDRLETMRLKAFVQGTRTFRRFFIRNGEQRSFVWTASIESHLEAAAGAILSHQSSARRACEVQYFQPDPEQHEHYLAIWHAGPLKVSHHMVEAGHELLAYFPALEALLIYHADSHIVHVHAQPVGAIAPLAQAFASVCFNTPLSAEPLDALFYELGQFREPVNLMDADAGDATIEHAMVISVTVPFGMSVNDLTITMHEDRSVWQLAEQQGGSHNLLSEAATIHAVRLGFEVRLPGTRRTRALAIEVAQDHSNVMSIRDPVMRRIGESILASLGILHRAQPEPAGSDLALFRQELTLLDRAPDIVSAESLLQIGLDLPRLEQAGLLVRQPRATRLRSFAASSGRRTERTLVAPSDAFELALPDSGTRDVHDRHYRVERAWLAERLRDVLGKYIVPPADPGREEPYFLGEYRIDAQPVPIWLVTQLGQEGHYASVERQLSGQRQTGLVLTPTAQSRLFLGRHVMVSISSLIGTVEPADADADADADVKLELARLEVTWRQYGEPGTHADGPVVKSDKHGGVLEGPHWPKSLVLHNPEQVMVVQRLVDAYHAGTGPVPGKVLLAGCSAPSMGRLFRGTQWLLYIEPADTLAKHRSWRLRTDGQ